jgi:hypothetical protein
MRYLSDDLLNPEPALRRIEAIKTSYRMWFPEDDRAYDEAIATISSEAIGKWTGDPEELVRRACASDPALAAYIGSIEKDTARLDAFVAYAAAQSLKLFTQQTFVAAGGFSTVAKATGTSRLEVRVNECLPQGEFAGLALYTLYRMHRHHAGLMRDGASINKLLALLGKWGRNGLAGVPRTETTMRKYWNAYRNVAHFWAACHHIDAVYDRNPVEQLLEDTLAFLRIAKSFEDFLITFFESRDPTWNPAEDVWRIPGDDSLALADMPNPLSLKAQTLLLDYKATLDG